MLMLCVLFKTLQFPLILRDDVVFIATASGNGKIWDILSTAAI